MKNIYFAVAEKQDGKNYNFVLKVSTSYNMLNVMETLSKKAYVVMYCDTKKEALNIVESWNQANLKEGTHLYQDWQAYKGEPYVMEYRGGNFY